MVDSMIQNLSFANILRAKYNVPNDLIKIIQDYNDQLEKSEHIEKFSKTLRLLKKVNKYYIGNLILEDDRIISNTEWFLYEDGEKLNMTILVCLKCGNTISNLDENKYYLDKCYCKKNRFYLYKLMGILPNLNNNKLSEESQLLYDKWERKQINMLKN